jgi:hypothetical protein
MPCAPTRTSATDAGFRWRITRCPARARTLRLALRLGRRDQSGCALCGTRRIATGIEFGILPHSPRHASLGHVDGGGAGSGEGAGAGAGVALGAGAGAGVALGAGAGAGVALGAGAGVAGISTGASGEGASARC